MRRVGVANANGCGSSREYAGRERELVAFGEHGRDSAGWPLVVCADETAASSSPFFVYVRKTWKAREAARRRGGEVALAGVISDFHPPGEVRIDARVVNKPDRPQEHTREGETRSTCGTRRKRKERTGERGRKGR